MDARRLLDALVGAVSRSGAPGGQGKSVLDQILGQLGSPAQSAGRQAGAVFNQATGGLARRGRPAERGDRDRPQGRSGGPRPDRRTESGRSRAEGQGFHEPQPRARRGGAARGGGRPVRLAQVAGGGGRRGEARRPRPDRRPRLHGLPELPVRQAAPEPAGRRRCRAARRRGPAAARPQRGREQSGDAWRGFAGRPVAASGDLGSRRGAELRRGPAERRGDRQRADVERRGRAGARARHARCGGGGRPSRRGRAVPHRRRPVAGRDRRRGHALGGARARRPRHGGRSRRRRLARRSSAPRSTPPPASPSSPTPCRSASSCAGSPGRSISTRRSSATSTRPRRASRCRADPLPLSARGRESVSHAAFRRSRNSPIRSSARAMFSAELA